MPAVDGPLQDARPGWTPRLGTVSRAPGGCHSGGDGSGQPRRDTGLPTQVCGDARLEAAALRQVQRSMIKQGHIAPYDWAAFVLHGDWR